MLSVWSGLLNRYINLPDILDLCQSLIELVGNMRDNFELYEGALEISVVKEYEKETRRRRTRVVQAMRVMRGIVSFKGEMISKGILFFISGINVIQQCV